MSPEAAAWQDAIARGRASTSADVGRVHRIVHVADTGHEQGGGTQLLTVGAVRQRARAA